MAITYAKAVNRARQVFGPTARISRCRQRTADGGFAWRWAILVTRDREPVAVAVAASLDRLFA